MSVRGKRRAAVVAVGLVAAALVAGAVIASPPSATDFTPIASANTRAAGYAPWNVLSPELREVVQAQGSTPVENPTEGIGFYGYLTDGPMIPSAAAPTVEASKTEPDKNTYLVFKHGLHGADAHYDYGTHFLYQGHELNKGQVTRINLDADGAHRVTVLATTDSNGQPIQTIDGSTWDPFAGRLLISSEAAGTGRLYQLTPDFPSTVDDLAPWLGRGGFEGIQNDSEGNVYYVEDVGGSTGTGANIRARRPNSYLYRFLPRSPDNLKAGGKIQALQVSVAGSPLVFGPTADGDINSPGYVALHKYGTSYPTKWITLATTTASSVAPGPDLNALARAAGATPFKRPENGLFRPGSKFREFDFVETGDTNQDTSAASSGGFGSLFKLVQSPWSNDGRISIVYLGDAVHSGFDNVAFFSRDQLGVVEDAGDGLHAQRNALDSAWMFDVTADYSKPANQPVRFIAEGRDPSATIDAGLAGTPGLRNEGDNEITGIHVSDGDPTVHGILGAKTPQPFRSDGHWRAFWTQQHGDNNTFELVAASKSSGWDEGHDD